MHTIEMPKIMCYNQILKTLHKIETLFEAIQAVEEF